MISLAGGLPETKTFPPELYAKLMSKVARIDDARCSTGRPRGWPARCVHRAGDGRERHVGGPRRGAGHHRRPTGDRPDVQGLHRPGRHDRGGGAHVSGRSPDVRRLPGEGRADRDGRRRHADRRVGGHARPPASRRAQPEVHLHDPKLPEPGRRDDVAGTPTAPGGGGARARDPGVGGQPLRPAALRGRAAANAALARRGGGQTRRRL